MPLIFSLQRAATTTDCGFAMSPVMSMVPSSQYISVFPSGEQCSPLTTYVRRVASSSFFRLLLKVYVSVSKWKARLPVRSQRCPRLSLSMWSMAAVTVSFWFSGKGKRRN